MIQKQPNNIILLHHVPSNSMMWRLMFERRGKMTRQSHCHSFNKQSRKEYINKNWLEFYRSEHESYVSNTWFLVVRESFIFIWILINRADMMSCPFSLFPFSLSQFFSHLVCMICCSPSFLFWSVRNNTIECLFPIKMMQQRCWRL